MTQGNRDTRLLTNVNSYKWSCYLGAMVIMWPVMALFYQARGLSFLQIASLQSTGALVCVSLEIPLGYVADRAGNRIVLIVGALSRFLAVFVLIVSDGFALFLLAEILFAIADAAQSGADTSLLYQTMTALGRTDDYRSLISRIRGRQSIIRIVSRMISTILYRRWMTGPFVVSLLFYGMIVICYSQFTDIDLTKQSRQENADSEGGTPIGILRKARMIARHYGQFFCLSLLSMTLVICASNYSQFLGPLLRESDFDTAYLGLILSSGGIFDYLGSRISLLIPGERQNPALVLCALMVPSGVILAGCSHSAMSRILAYFAISLFHTPFNVLLSNAINQSINPKYRTTLLSISNQIDSVGTVLADPAIGAMLDSQGFGRTYVIVGTSCLSIVLLLGAGVCRRSRRGRANGEALHP